MYSTIGNSVIPNNGSTLVSTTTDAAITLQFYSTTGGATAITQIKGQFSQLVIVNGGAVQAYVSLDGGITWHVLPPATGSVPRSILFDNEALSGAETIRVARPQGGSNVTNISAWANPVLSPI